MQKLELLDWPQKALGFYVAVDDTPLFMVGDVAVYELAFEEQAINIERRGVHLGRFRHVATKGGRLHVFDFERRRLRVSLGRFTAHQENKD
ncbi:hypothetical protein [Paraburkholderia xenovorans]